MTQSADASNDCPVRLRVYEVATTQRLLLIRTLADIANNTLASTQLARQLGQALTLLVAVPAQVSEVAFRLLIGSIFQLLSGIAQQQVATADFIVDPCEARLSVSDFVALEIRAAQQLVNVLSDLLVAAPSSVSAVCNDNGNGNTNQSDPGTPSVVPCERLGPVIDAATRILSVQVELAVPGETASFLGSSQIEAAVRRVPTDSGEQSVGLLVSPGRCMLDPSVVVCVCGLPMCGMPGSVSCLCVFYVFV